jgi:hypothetical protein
VAGAVVLCAVACGPLPVDLSTRPRSFGSRDYERIFEQWTRETQGYNLDTLENALTVSATYHSWEFRQAWVQRYADDYRLAPSEVEELVEQQRLELEAAHEFLVAATATKSKWADFTREDSPWVIALVNDRGDEVQPMQIEKVEPTAQMLTYYSYITVYRKTFLVRFPRSLPDGGDVLEPGIGAFSLLFSGPLGRAELEWEVRAEQ